MRFIDSPIIEPDVDRTLREWARWARSWHAGPATCRSVEGRYIPEAGEVWEQEPKPLPIDAREAWRIECIWRTRLPMPERLVLKAHYVTAPTYSSDAWLAHVRRTARELRIPVRDYSMAVTTAARAVSPWVRQWW